MHSALTWLCCAASHASNLSIQSASAGASPRGSWRLSVTSSEVPRCRIIVLVGLPGSGKSTYAEEHGLQTLSSDHIRSLLAGDPADQSIHPRVFASLRYLLRQRIAIGRPVTCIDATNLTPGERKPYLKIGERYGCAVEAIFFDTPPEVCKQRNRLRNRNVPESVIDAMAARMAPPSPEEGFSRIRVVRG